MRTNHTHRTFTIHTLSGATFTCEQFIRVRKPNFDDLDLPISLDFACDVVIELDENGNPHPNATGYPSIETAFGTVLLDPDYCNLTANYIDEVEGGCVEDKLIRRNWTITDECLPGQVLTHLQIITIEGFGTASISCNIETHTGPVIDGNIMVFGTDPLSWLP